jgi:mycothiol synthase
MNDAEAICRLVAECEHDLDGKAEVDVEDIVADLGRPGFDPATDTVLVHEPDGSLAGWAQVRESRAEADVRPDRRGRGIGTWLLEWTERRARGSGATKVGQTITDRNTAAARMFRDRGYLPRDTAWLLEIPLHPDQPVAPPPAGITIRGYRTGTDDRAVHRVIDDAFSEWPDRDPRPFEEWVPFSIGRQTFSPELSALALDGDRIVGAAIVLDYRNAGKRRLADPAQVLAHDKRRLADPAQVLAHDEGYVHQLAVHRGYRHRGIARALLHRAFAGFARTGRRWCTLSTNSYTGALSLYERVGMRIRHSYTHYSKEL